MLNARRIVALSAALLLLCLTASADYLRGRCTRVLTGDTIKVRTTACQTLTVHLAGVIAPRLAQPYGEAARQALERAILGHGVTLVVKAVSSDGLVQAVVYEAGDWLRPLSGVMVRQGWAWPDPDNLFLEGLEEKQALARSEGAGLWADANPVPPWAWRPQVVGRVVEPPAPKAVVPLKGDAFDRLNPNYTQDYGDPALVQAVIRERQYRDEMERRQIFNEFVAPYLWWWAPYCCPPNWGFPPYFWEWPGNGCLPPGDLRLYDLFGCHPW